MSDIILTPGSMGAAKLALDLYGIDRVDAGTWGSPVTVRNLDNDEVDFAKQFFAEYDLNVQVIERKT